MTVKLPAPSFNRTTFTLITAAPVFSIWVQPPKMSRSASLSKSPSATARQLSMRASSLMSATTREASALVDTWATPIGRAPSSDGVEPRKSS